MALEKMQRAEWPRIDVFGLTDRGRKRARNEDQVLVAKLEKSMVIEQTSLPVGARTKLLAGPEGRILLVADGVGGHSGGAHASALAADTVAEYVLNAMPWFFGVGPESSQEELEEELKAALERSQEQVKRSAEQNPLRSQMATTLTMACVLWPTAYVVHVGDSRCYLLRDGGIEQITTDHTMAEALREEGVLSKEAARRSKWSHVLYKSIGGETNGLSPDLYRVGLTPGDRLVLCTDGLSKHVLDEEVAELVETASGSEAACRELIATANERGGTDNVTVIVADFIPLTGEGVANGGGHPKSLVAERTPRRAPPEPPEAPDEKDEKVEESTE